MALAGTRANRESPETNSSDEKFYVVLQACMKTLERFNFLEDDVEVLQVGCICLWNMCLPFFNEGQANNGMVRKAIELIARILENIKSINYPLRCQVHWFLAKCYADRDLSEEAFRELSKARSFDENLKYGDSMDHFAFCLKSRTKLYTTPKNLAERARQLIEHVVATATLSKRNIWSTACLTFKSAESCALPDENANLIKFNSPVLRSLLLEAGAILAPGKFKELVRLSEGISSVVADQSGSGPTVLLHEVNKKVLEFRENWENSEAILTDGMQPTRESDLQDMEESSKSFSKHHRFVTSCN
ncbi:unnamed protein product [Dibothriocephalus latus]|uniref:Uncharacterized protein n=1 Tax=Dibothriocephalus latus TaxID=60516 RepID=A0A3P7LV31_DIBLA|nr:unnamed protein product [Dibothriocephalus latus]